MTAMDSGSIASSGDYERFFIYDNIRYCHILNPQTGCPVQGMASVTVCAESCLVAGTASTIAMLKEQSGPQWLESLGLPYLLIDKALQASGTITTT
jgi:thiamine biosynthesis lipoprotein